MTPDQIQEQKDFLLKSEKMLGINSVEMANALCVSYATYGKWRRGERELRAATTTSVKMLVLMKLCSDTKRDAFAEWMKQVQLSQPKH